MYKFGEDRSSSFGGELPNPNTLRVDVVVRRISSNISGYTGPILTIFPPYESTLRVDDGTVLHFAIGQGTLSWKPIKVEKLANLFVALPF